MKDTLHKSHHDVTLNLIDTILSAVEENFDKKEVLTRAELLEAFEKVRTYLPHTQALFDATCKQCVALNRKVYAPDSRRKDFLTRLIFSKIVTTVGPLPVARSNRHYPHVLIPGIQANVKAIFPESEWAIFNQLARDLYAEAGTDGDVQVWEKIRASEPLTISANRVFVRMLLNFRSFNMRLWEFIRILQHHTDQALYKPNEYDFCELFEALFNEFEDIPNNDVLRQKINTYYGDESAEQMNAVLMAYKRYRDGLDNGIFRKRAEQAHRFSQALQRRQDDVRATGSG